MWLLFFSPSTASSPPGSCFRATSCCHHTALALTFLPSQLFLPTAMILLLGSTVSRLSAGLFPNPCSPRSCLLSHDECQLWRGASAHAWQRFLACVLLSCLVSDAGVPLQGGNAALLPWNQCLGGTQGNGRPASSGARRSLAPAQSHSSLPVR